MNGVVSGISRKQLELYLERVGGEKEPFDRLKQELKDDVALFARLYESFVQHLVGLIPFPVDGYHMPLTLQGVNHVFDRLAILYPMDADAINQARDAMLALLPPAGAGAGAGAV